MGDAGRRCAASSSPALVDGGYPLRVLRSKGTSRSVAAFCVLAYGISWALWSPLWLAELGWVEGERSYLWHFAGAFGPLLAAVIVAIATEGASGLRRLGSSLIRWQAPLRWWAFTLLFSPGLFLAAAAVMRLVDGEWLDFGQFGSITEYPGVAGWIGLPVWILTFGLGEETGWRGYALPRLQQGGWSAMRATYLVGGLWALWHLPTFSYNYDEFGPFIFIGFFIGIMAGAVLLTSLYNSTGGSLLLCVLWHGIYNATVNDADAAVSAAVTAAVIGWAMFAGRRFGPETLAPGDRVPPSV